MNANQDEMEKIAIYDEYSDKTREAFHNFPFNPRCPVLRLVFYYSGRFNMSLF